MLVSKCLDNLLPNFVLARSLYFWPDFIFSISWENLIFSFLVRHIMTLKFIRKFKSTFVSTIFLMIKGFFSFLKKLLISLMGLEELNIFIAFKRYDIDFFCLRNIANVIHYFRWLYFLWMINISTSWYKIHKFTPKFFSKLNKKGLFHVNC